MDKIEFNKWLNISKCLSKYSVESGSLVLLFENNVLEGLLYRNELGYVSLGYTDGKGCLIDFKSFQVLASFMDIVEARKSVKETEIEFRKDDKNGRLDIMESLEINLPVWKSGESIEIKEGDVFSLGSNMEYFLVDGWYCFGVFGIFGRKKVEGLDKYKIKMSPIFVEVLELSKITKFMVSEDSVLFSEGDLEVFLFSAVEGSEVSLMEKFSREKAVIQAESSLNLKDEKDVKNIIDSLREFKNLGASYVSLSLKGNKVILNSVIGAHVTKSLGVKSESEFNGVLSDQLLEILGKVGDQVNSVCIDNIMILFEGKIELIATVMEKVK